MAKNGQKNKKYSIKVQFKKARTMELQGKVIKILDAQRFVSKKNNEEYVKNSFVVETSGQYPKHVAFSVMGADKFAQMNIVEGGVYNISFDVESREWNGKWFTDVNAWRATPLVSKTDVYAQANTQSAPQPQTQAQAPQSNAQKSDKGEDLPF